MKKLLADGKTDLLKEFVSNRTRRKFSAYLVAQDGKVGFEFEKKGPSPRRRPRKRPRETSARRRGPGQLAGQQRARTASMACGRGKVTRQTRPTVAWAAHRQRAAP
jgi:ribosomal protein L19E